MFCKINDIAPYFVVKSVADKHYKTGYNIYNAFPDIKLYGMAHGMKAYV